MGLKYFIDIMFTYLVNVKKFNYYPFLFNYFYITFICKKKWKTNHIYDIKILNKFIVY